jgi:hypothetical protein
MFVLVFFVLLCHCTVADPIRLSCLELSQIRIIKSPSLALFPKLGTQGELSNTFLIWDCLNFNDSRFIETLGPISYHPQKKNPTLELSLKLGPTGDQKWRDSWFGKQHSGPGQWLRKNYSKQLLVRYLNLWVKQFEKSPVRHPYTLQISCIPTLHSVRSRVYGKCKGVFGLQCSTLLTSTLRPSHWGSTHLLWCFSIPLSLTNVPSAHAMFKHKQCPAHTFINM